MRILAIDDNQDNLTALQAVLSDRLPEAGILTASSGPAGLDLARAEDPDVILLDIVMPGMDGYEVCRRLKEDPLLPAIPVLFLTANRTDRASRVKALEAGAEGFLAKPFDDLELTAQIRSMVKIKAAASRQHTENERLASLVEERTRSLMVELDERKRAEKALQESEERFRSLFERAPLGYQSLDTDGKFIEVNDAWLEALGYAREEVIGRWFGDFLAPESVQGFRERFTAFKARGRVHSEFYMLHKSGDRRYMAFDGRIGHNSDGSFKQTHCILADHTERMRAEMALQASERELLEAQRLAGIGSWSYDLATQQPEWSEGMFRIWGLDPKLGPPSYSDHQKLIHKDDYQRFDDAVEQAVQHGTPYELELRICRPDGRTATIITVGEAQCNAAGDVVSLRGTNQDSPERKEREAAVRAGEARLQDIVSSMGGWVWETDENGMYTYISQKGIDLLGVPCEEIIGKTPFDFMPADEAARMAARFAKIVGNKDPIVDLENWNTRANGEQVCFLTNAFPILDEAGNLKGYRGVDSDITERKRAERLRQLSSEVLGILNEPLPFADTIQRTLAAIKQETGFDAVGMRLQDGDDFPYLSQDGFSAEFIEAENALAERDESGDVCRDKNGDICLSCTCGLVISGKTDAGNALFTPGGSFWTNDSSPLLDLSAEEDPRSQPRNRCIHDGYASVALIPIRANQEIVGLLHLNDRRQGCFTLRQIQFFEGVCASISSALIRNRAQEQLRASEESYRNQFAMNSAVMLLVDPADGAILDANAAALAFYGYSRDQLLAMHIMDVNTKPAPEVQQAMDSVQQEHGELFQFQHRLADGSTRDVSVSSSRIQIGERTVLHSIISDITERKRAEEKVHAHAQRLTLHIKYTPLAVIEWDLDFRAVEWNPAAERMFGYSRDEALGRHAADLVIPDEAKEHVDLIWSALLEGKGGTKSTNANRTKGGGMLVCDWYNTTLISSDGVIIGAASLVQDVTERRKAEEELRGSRAALLQIMQSVSFGVVVVGRDKKIRQMNPAAAAMAGYDSEAELVGTVCHGTVCPSSIGACPVLDLGEEIDRSERLLVRRDGSTIPILKSVVPVELDGEDVLLESFVDITEGKEAEERSRQKDALLNEVGQIARIGGWEMDLVTRKANWTRTTYDVVGIDPGDPIPGPDEHLDYYLPEYRPLVAEAMRALIEENRPLDFEAKAHTAKGNIRWFHAIGRAVLQEGKCVKVHGTLQDITERKQAEEKILQQQSALEKAQELGQIGSWELDLRRNKLYWTDENCRIFATPPGSVVDYELFLGKVHPDDRDYVDHEWRAALDGKPYDIEHRLDLDGTVRWVREKASVEFDEKGEAVRGIGFTQDITERRLLEERLRQSGRMDAVGQLAGGIAHDFNNMLEVILGHTEMAMDDVDSTQPLYEDLQEVLKAARRSAVLTRQLLTFARKQAISPEIVDMNETVEGMLKMLRRLIGENIDLNWQPGAGLWPVMMDPSQIDQILANLCVNGRDAIAGVGKITIKTGNCTLDELYCSAHVDMVPGEFAQLTVSDNGCGMDQETAARIFEPFFTTKASGKGTGLGLATVYGIVKQNNGCIDTYSKPGLGTTFRIHLPRHVGAAPAVTGEAAEPPMRGNETILLVEDESSILRMAKKMLEKQGYIVLAAATPREAVRLFTARADEIDLLITDVIMPEMDGWDLATQLLAIRPDLKCLFMSGYTADVIADHGVLDEGVHFIHKPFSIGDLTGKVREVLEENQGG
jgi:PAS domain S-box-containing protein